MPSTREIKAAVRNQRLAHGQTGPRRSTAEMIAFLTSYTGADSKAPEIVRQLCQTLIAFQRGEITEKQMHDALMKLNEQSTV
jgi:hypothetical protein